MILDAIQQRRSAMSFLPETIEQDLISQFLEAATLAPSAFNEQPWRFYVTTRQNMEAFNLMLSTMSQSNQNWAQNASVLVATAALTNVTRTGEPNYHALHDLGMATALLMIQAQALGLVSHPLSGFSYETLRERFNIPESQTIGAMVAVGLPGSLDHLSERQRERALAPRNRKPLNEVVTIL